MKPGLKKALFWVLAVLIACSAMYYQRMTGPSYPKKYEFSVGNEEYSFSLPRSNNGLQRDYPVKI